MRKLSHSRKYQISNTYDDVRLDKLGHKREKFLFRILSSVPHRNYCHFYDFEVNSKGLVSATLPSFDD